MNGETNLELLCRDLKPFLNKGDYVFCSFYATIAPSRLSAGSNFTKTISK